jgi:diguanylate cyclase (GGDEF)-like protein
MRERIGIYEPDEGTFRLIPRLLQNPSVEITAIVVLESESQEARGSADPTHPDPAIQSLLTRDSNALLRDPALSVVIDAGTPQSVALRHPELVERNVAIVSPFVARLLWGLDADDARRRHAALHALRDIAAAADASPVPEDLCRDLLQIALRVTNAEGGSFLVREAESGDLRVAAAVGIERVLWPTIRIPPGAGIAGRIAALRRPLRLLGRALEHQFLIIRERRDIAACLSIPLLHDGRVLGVLNLHHGSRTDAFDDVEFAHARQLTAVFARIFASAEAQATLRRRAGRDAAARRVREIFDAGSEIDERLVALCLFVAEWVGSGVASVYLAEAEGEALRLAATSLEGSRYSGEYRLSVGQGIDGAVAQSRSPSFLHRRDGRLAYAALPLLADERLSGVLTVQIGMEGSGDPEVEGTLREIAATAADSILRDERERRTAERADKLGAIAENHLRMIDAADLAEVVRLGTSATATVLLADQDLPSDPASSWFTTAAQSAIATPLWHDGRIVGTLAVYDRVADDPFSAGNFADDDIELLGRFGATLEQAIENAIVRGRTDRSPALDADTGLADAASVAETIHAEIVRAASSNVSLALAVCSIENFDDLDALAEGARTPRLAQRIAESMRAHVRAFDIVSRSGPSEFTVVLPQPGPDPAERIVALARAVADHIAKDDPLNDPLRVELGFGYAVYPEDGRDRESLLQHARTIRIQML